MHVFQGNNVISYFFIGVGRKQTFEYFRFPEPQSDLTVIIGNEVLGLNAVRVGSDFNASHAVSSGVDSLTLTDNYEFPTALNFIGGDDAGYIFSYDF